MLVIENNKKFFFLRPASARNRAITLRGQKTRKLEFDFKSGKNPSNASQPSQNGVLRHLKVIYIKKLGFGPVSRSHLDLSSPEWPNRRIYVAIWLSNA